MTISDEAFAIFTIERNWTIWKNELAGEAVTLRSGDYTTKNTNVKFGGWTRKGMDRFEEICREVINVRCHFKKRAEMENNYKNQKILLKAAKNTKNMKDLDNEVAQGRIVWNEFMLNNDVNDFPGTYVTTTTIYEAIIYSPLILKQSKKIIFTSDNKKLREKDKSYETNDDGEKLNKGTNENNQAVVYETSSETENQIRDSQSLTDGFGRTGYFKGYYSSDDGDDSDSDSKSASY